MYSCPLHFSRCQQRRYLNSLLDKLTDSDGNLITDYTPAVSSHVDTADEYLGYGQAGIRRVVTDGSAKSVFSGSPVEVAGKTGTAQEDRSRANHAFFVPLLHTAIGNRSDSKYHMDMLEPIIHLWVMKYYMVIPRWNRF